MGLIKAAIGATGGVLADQWKEYFYCEGLDADVLVAKGQKRTSGRSSNTKGSENIITDGSGIVVADGQCMIIVEQGQVVEVCAEPGQFTYNTSTEPSIFAGDMKSGVDEIFDKIGKRFAFGGDTGNDQRVYYFNTKEIVGNKYGTAAPVPFRVVDRNIGLDIDIAIRCNGEYSYRITNPILFYTNVCGNVESVYMRSEIDSMLKSELMTALQPAFSAISEMGIRYSALPGHTMQIADALNHVLSEKWRDTRGIEIASFAVNSVSASKEDEDMIKQMQKNAVLKDPTMAAATLAGAQAQAMQDAAKNQGGAFMAFAGMNAAQNAGGMQAENLFQMGQQAQQNQAAAPPLSQTMQQPAAQSWTCRCGALNTGKFCQECGNPKPSAVPVYKCDKCGWEPSDPSNPPKFCPECGDRFDKNDER